MSFSSAFTPGDSRRFCGPPGATSYSNFVDKSTKKGVKGRKGAKKSAASNDKLKHRDIFLRTGVLSQSSGSAYIEQGSTKVIVGVHGPREIPRRSDFSMKGVLACHVQLAPFSAAASRRAPGVDHEARELANIVKEALEATVCLHLYPKSQVDVFITILEDDGSSLAAAITCAGLAVADAAIDMFDVIVGSSLRRIGDKTVTDPTLEEEKELSTSPSKSGDEFSLTIGYLPSLDQVAALLQEGTTSSETLIAEVETLTALCREVQPCVQQSLVEAVRDNNKRLEMEANPA